MKKIILFYLIILSSLAGFSQGLNYNFTAVSGAYAANGTGSVSLVAASTDELTTASTNIGFNFTFGCQTYTTFRASSNGYICLGSTALAALGYNNDLNGYATRPIIAPLWDDLATGSGGNVNYLLSGTAPNRILTIEWKQMEWSYAATTWGVEFQIKLYEGSGNANRIEFIYNRNGNATANLNTASASIGLGGVTVGDFYSLNGTGTGPAASKVTETNNLNSKPATGQIYRWDPIICSGLPSAGTPSATPSANCAAFTTTLTTSGANGCGITYQWQQSNTGLPLSFSNIGSASTSPTQTFAVTGTKYFQCVVACASSGLSSTSSVISASVTPNFSGNGSFPITLPYSATGETTCGLDDDITSTNVTNVCGNSNFYTGEDAVYIFTPTVTAVLNATASATFGGTYLGMTLYQGCPTGTGVCVANAQSSSGTQSFGCTATINAGSIYYLVVDSRGNQSICNDFDLTLSAGCSAIAGGTAVASPTTGCAGYTSTLSLTGASSVCGLSYQWQSATASGGPYSAISGATAVTATVSVPGTRFYRCIITCGAFTATSTAVQTTTVAVGVGVTLPYSSGAVTTCGAGNNMTSTNVTNVCGSTLYYTGEDRTYRFTPATSGQLNINLGSGGTYTGLMLYDGCPNATGNCVVNSQSSTGSKILCANVTAGTTYYLIVDSYAAPTCNAYSVTISSPSSAATTTCSMAYTAALMTYSLETYAGTVLPTTDDVLFNSIINFGFPVCFDGAKYYGGYVASNAAFVFDAIPCYPNIQTSAYAAGGVATGYTIPTPAPTATTSIPRNAILAPWHDINPAIAGGVMSYTTVGTAPNRRCVITFSNIAMYGCNSLKHTSQIKIFETTNDIEIHIGNKPVCATWDNGSAVLGLHNYDGTKYVPPVNATLHNANPATSYTWSMSNTAYKFTTSCGLSGGVCLTLPIGFKAFYGERVDHINHLYWQTATESDLKDFAVQRSTDGVNFETIGHVHPNNTPGNYTFDDADAPVGIISYYRVEIDEYNGTTSYTDIYPIGSGANEILNVSKLYPNPANNEFSIAFDAKKSGSATINVYDVYGKLIKTVLHDVYSGVTRATVDTKELPFGVYYVEIVNSFDETITKQKLIIQK